jgi:hypothetical protein
LFSADQQSGSELPFANIRERERIEQKREYCQVLKINVEQAKPSQGSLPSRGGSLTVSKERRG